MNSQLVTNGLKILVGLVAMFFIGVGSWNLQWTGKIEKGTKFTPQDSTVSTSITKNKNEQALQIESTVKQKQITYSSSKIQYVSPFSDDLLKAQNDTALKLIFTGVFLLLLLALLPGLKDFNFLNLFSASFQDRVNTMQQLHNDTQQTLAGTPLPAAAVRTMLPEAAKITDVRPSTGITEKNFRKMTQNVIFDSLPDQNFTFAQLALNRPYGTDSVTQKIEEENKSTIYLYDLYLGEVKSDRRSYFYLSYPYARLGKILDESFKGKILKTIIKPVVPTVLHYMQNRGVIGLTKIEHDRLNIDITKYSAEITEEANANRINISGKNPLNSHVYDILNKDPQVFLKPISLKLKCIIDEVGMIELAFDKLGNMKFWLRQNGQQNILSILPTTLEFFSEIKALKGSPYINSLSLLEDEQ
jgi:hypothetical protein